MCLQNTYSLQEQKHRYFYNLKALFSLYLKFLDAAKLVSTISSRLSPILQNYLEDIQNTNKILFAVAVTFVTLDGEIRTEQSPLKAVRLVIKQKLSLRT